MKKALPFLIIPSFLSLYCIFLYQTVAREKQSQIALMKVKTAVLEESHAQQEKRVSDGLRIILSDLNHFTEINDDLKGFALVDSNVHLLESAGVPIVMNNRAKSMLKAALRGRATVELVEMHGLPVWFAMQPVGNMPTNVFCAIFAWHPAGGSMTAFLQDESKYLLWLNHKLLFPNERHAKYRLPEIVVETVMERENNWTGVLHFDDEWVLAGAIAVKDFDAWEVTGGLMMAEPFQNHAALLMAAASRPAAMIGLAALLLTGMFTTHRSKRAIYKNKRA